LDAIALQLFCTRNGHQDSNQQLILMPGFAMTMGNIGRATIIGPLAVARNKPL
jgi:hypothetical protein